MAKKKNKKLNVFISGRVSGISYTYARREFKRRQNVLQSLDFVGRVYNPIELCQADWSWLRCMVKCLYFLIFRSNTISMLGNWSESRGSKIELFFALLTFKKII